jgi:hypothetical protein
MEHGLQQTRSPLTERVATSQRTCDCCQVPLRRAEDQAMLRPPSQKTLLRLGVFLLCGCTCPTTTIGGLLRKQPISKREVVCLRAVYRGSIDCEPCPPDALCQPCTPVVLLAEAHDTPAEHFIWVFGSAEGLVEGRAYTFELDLRPGFAKQLRSQNNNPVYFDGPPPLELCAVRD